MVRYARRADATSLARRSPALRARYLADGARRSIVTIFTMAGFADITAVSGVRTIAVGKAQDGMAISGTDRPVDAVQEARAGPRQRATCRQANRAARSHVSNDLAGRNAPLSGTLRNSETASDQRLNC